MCHNMDGPRQYYAKWNKSDRDECHMISLTHRMLKKKKKNKVKQNLTDTDNRLVRERELGVSVKWVTGLKCMVMDGN